jgi:hypothetical protein
MVHQVGEANHILGELVNSPALPIDLTTAREMFAHLVRLQDEGLDHLASRKVISDKFGVPEDTVLKVERVGVLNNWPPLG